MHILTELWVWLTLWLSAFSSATLLPGSSELVLAALWWQGYTPLLLWAVATFGNVAGSVVNWWLGGQVCRFSDKAWFPATPAQLERAQQWFERWGKPALLLSWVPIIGDPLTLVAGAMRMRLRLFISLVLLAKGGRYALLLLLAEQWLPPPG